MRTYPEARIKHALTLAAILIGASPAMAGTDPTITGDYVEARTAEVFAGGCIMNSEAGTMGRQAVMAWRITSGSVRGAECECWVQGAGCGVRVLSAVPGRPEHRSAERH